MGYEEFGKLIESGDAEAVAKVLNAMEGQAQQLMLSYLTDEQLEKLNDMLDGGSDNGDTDDNSNISESNDTDGEELTIWDDIDSGDFPAKEFAFDGNHKFYIIANDTEARQAIDNGYEIYPIEQLHELYESADPLKFISSWDLDTEYMPQAPFEESSTDANGDGDTDVVTADTNGNGEPDTAVAAGDDAKEEKDAVKAAKEDLGLDGEDDTSTGKKKKELDDEEITVSDKKQKSTCSDSRQKNILSALSELRF